jgi:ABC-2 type transport system permease protein
MKKFLTLLRRDMADNRGALIITPLVIAAVILLLGAFATFSGNGSLGFNTKDFARSASESSRSDVSGAREVKPVITIDANAKYSVKQGDTIIEEGLGIKSADGLGLVMPIASSFVAAIPIGVTAIIVLFLLSGSLYDERKDRTILFWKSLPVSDLAYASAKMASIIGLGFMIAFGVAMVLQTGAIVIAGISLTSLGVTGIPLGALFTNMALIWVVGIIALVTYIGWAMPVYAWFLAVSAGAPKAPFIAALLPIGLLPVLARIVGLPGEFDVWGTPLRLLAGDQAFKNLNLSSSIDIRLSETTLPIRETIIDLTSTMTQPAFWIGLLIAAALVFAASEIRRRRAL